MRAGAAGAGAVNFHCSLRRRKKKEEGRRKKEEGRRKKEEGKKEEGK
ncbi:MAG: hypothetical protein HC894_03610, partial [Microcoleus sp. SM1_3_4]|nr:hypothetical protein [Microcoleus sp. SM1_3_4]